VVTLQQEHAKSPSMMDTVRPSELVDAALELMKESSVRHRLEVVREIAFDGANTLDRHQVLQILVNLITNARQAMAGSEVRRLSISVTPHGSGAHQMVQFSVRDTGMGIAPEHVTRIFQHGFTTKSDGHGFGLHSAGVAAQAMGGSLTARSDGPGKGAEFVLSLPALPPAQQRSTNKAPACTAS
jgi:signal transduction histidine kinase